MLSSFKEKPYHYILIKGLSLWVLFIFTPSFFSFNELFSSQSFLVHSHFKIELYSFSFFLLKLNSSSVNFISLISLLLVAAYQLFFMTKHALSLTILQFVLMSNLQMFFYPDLSSGWALIGILYSYLILSDILSILSKRKFSIDYFLLTFVKSQLIIIYLMAFFAKIQGDSWISGAAVMQAFHNPLYSHFLSFIKEVPDALFIIGNYSVLFFQATFIFAMRYEPIKRYYIYTGFLLHTMLFVFFGLSTFLAAMFLSLISFFYVDDKVFVVDSEKDKIKNN